MGSALVRMPVAELASEIQVAGRPSRERLAASFMRLPLRFEENRGQADGQVKYTARGLGYALFLTPTEAVLTLRGPQESEARSQKSGELRASWIPASARKYNARRASGPPAVLRLQLAGANPSPVVEGIEPLPGRSNYLIGNDPTKWRTGVPSFAKVQYRDVYPGVDLVYYGNRQQLEYDFVVQPGASPHALGVSRKS